ncbi:deleted in malignant brain tumors 1 protein-like [Lampris incognitus]|uniref:deleted in malignant brain tumors 1 protein-like n=1 Tax=Lampris incognitus TaxID=2546036 RepID=UPI0024B527D9|nr:deleted in malignant brain tumors 1 protein-like [Lampris incognitus]
MNLVTYVIVVQLSCLCQALHNSSTPSGQNGQSKPNDPMKDVDGDPYVLQHASRCQWTLKMPANGSSSLVSLTAETRDALFDQICQDLGCGRVSKLSENSSPHSHACLHNCFYLDHHLRNCSEVVGSHCTIISEVVCDHAVRLAGGTDHCAGRVELWRDGEWGTVCDDQWDLKDADVVCAQLDCGYAINVSGQGGSFPSGKGPIYLDELNCSGTESTLWDCPAIGDGHDCGHKEDAGVICSEMRAVRLTGGLDRCAGKVEVHRNGTWGTVCDPCWDKEMASMVCTMLKCGNESLEYTRFDPPLEHNNGSLWFYTCYANHKDLWECDEYINNIHLCKDTRAAGLICKGSYGFPIATTSNVTLTNGWTTAYPGTTTVSSDGRFFSIVSPELLGCFTLSLLLFVTLITNAVVCCHRRRNAHLLQQNHTSLRMASEHQDNDYRDAINLIKVTTCPMERDVPQNPRYLWTQLSGADSTSLDTDYETNDPSNDTSVHLSTFRNSRRYRQDMRNPMTGTSASCSLPEEGMRNPHQSPTCQSGSDSSRPIFNEYQRYCEETGNGLNPGGGNDGDGKEDSLYCPVSPDSQPSSSDDDYDDIGN